MDFHSKFFQESRTLGFLPDLSAHPTPLVSQLDQGAAVGMSLPPHPLPSPEQEPLWASLERQVLMGESGLSQAGDGDTDHCEPPAHPWAAADGPVL